MYQGELWKYCTKEQCREMLLSLKLLGDTDWPEEKVISCLYAVSNHAESHYRMAQIPKRDGGTRKLLVPDPLLKQIQKNILHHVLDGMEVSPCAAAYRKGRTLSGNACVHTGKPLILKLDIEDFFGSILFPAVLQNAFPAVYFPTAVGTLLTVLCCCHDRLPQGAPTSPAISNLVMKPFDRYMEEWCGERKIAYTRYCDDMTFSGDFDAKTVYRKVKGFLGAMGMELNEKKTKAVPFAYRQTVTGIVVNEKLQVPRDYRRKLRQEVYYFLKYGMEENADASSLPSLLGKVNFVLQVNPEDRWFADAKEKIREMIEKKER